MHEGIIRDVLVPVDYTDNPFIHMGLVGKQLELLPLRFEPLLITRFLVKRYLQLMVGVIRSPKGVRTSPTIGCKYLFTKHGNNQQRINTSCNGVQ